MSFFKPFSRIISEVRDLFSIEYPAIVESNEDPEKLGRIKCRFSIVEDIPTEHLPWCVPKLPTFLGQSTNTGFFAVPEVGSSVVVKFVNNDKYHPQYICTRLNTRNKCTLFDEDYPESYGFVDSLGNYFKINKVKKEIKIYHSTGSSILINDYGDIKLTHTNGNSLYLRASGMYVEAPNVHVDGTFTVSTGIDGVITSTDGQQFTVSGGVIINVV